MKRAQKALRIMQILDELYPATPIPLDHNDPYTLLVAVMLSAQTTDKKVNQVTPELFSLANTPEMMAELEVDEIQAIIREVGLAPTKARNLKKIWAYAFTSRKWLSKSLPTVKAYAQIGNFSNHLLV